MLTLYPTNHTPIKLPGLGTFEIYACKNGKAYISEDASTAYPLISDRNDAHLTPECVHICHKINLGEPETLGIHISLLKHSELKEFNTVDEIVKLKKELEELIDKLDEKDILKKVPF